MNIRPPTGMFKYNCADIAVGIQVRDRVFIEIFRFDHAAIAEFDVQRIGVFEALNFHGSYPGELAHQPVHILVPDAL